MRGTGCAVLLFGLLAALVGTILIKMLFPNADWGSAFAGGVVLTAVGLALARNGARGYHS